MRFHHALVDDLISWDEFQARVEAKVEEFGDLVDDHTAAMMVVTDLGRHHVKVAGLTARSSLFSFFAKVVKKGEAQEFDRPDGERGARATVLVGDETGTTLLVLWDEKACAAGEINEGDVLEVIGRHAGKSPGEITVLAFRPALCEISCAAALDATLPARPEREAIEVRLLARSEVRTYSKRNGEEGTMIEAIVGDAQGPSRLVAWEPGLLSGYDPPVCIRIEGALKRDGQEVREYSIDTQSTLAMLTIDIPAHLTRVVDIGTSAACSCAGTVVALGLPREVLTRGGRVSMVRNLTLADGTAQIQVALWGEAAVVPLMPGDEITLYLATTRARRNGGCELSVGKGFAVEVADLHETTGVHLEGSVLVTRNGTFLICREATYLLDHDLPHGTEVAVDGLATGMHLAVSRVTEISATPGQIREEIAEFLAKSGGV